MLSLVLASFALVPSLYPSFHEWSVVNGRTYLTPTERDYRESVYNMNVRKIARHNNRGLSWKMGVNKFADMTKKEFSEVYLNNGYYNETTRPVRDYNWYYAFVNATTLPSSVDWTTKGAVTPVKNQQQCGSCWAFSSTGALEGAWFVKHGVLTNLSEQQLVDCSVPQGNQGCNGGLMDSAFQYVIKNGLTTEAAYPYTATGPNTCVAAGLPVAVTASSFKDVPTNSDSALMAAVVQQPVSVAVEADQNSFQFYSSGVLTASCGTNLDHGVLVVGYGVATGLDYYKVKNSWGADWGESGYIRLARGASYNGGAGQCGILMDPSYPVV
jgi:KDEL-tailed cysteine endopeptidase